MKTPSDYARSIRYATLMTMIAAASAVQACSSDTILAVPSSGTRIPASVPPSAPAPQIRVSGTVTDDDGVPVAGVKVTLYRWVNGLSASSTVTDTMGFYSFFSPSEGGGMSILTEKAGYESKWHSRSNPPANFQFDLRIHRIN